MDDIIEASLLTSDQAKRLAEHDQEATIFFLHLQMQLLCFPLPLPRIGDTGDNFDVGHLCFEA